MAQATEQIKQAERDYRTWLALREKKEVDDDFHSWHALKREKAAAEDAVVTNDGERGKEASA